MLRIFHAHVVLHKTGKEFQMRIVTESAAKALEDASAHVKRTMRVYEEFTVKVKA
jgi:hypothetical protein